MTKYNFGVFVDKDHDKLNCFLRYTDYQYLVKDPIRQISNIVYERNGKNLFLSIN